MKVRKQFQPLERSTVVTVVVDHVGKFVPEMSMSVKDILSQFAYVDNVRLVDLAKQGYQGTDDDSAFDLPDFDTLDIAEKQELYEYSRDFINKYEQQRQAQANNSAPESAPANVDADE